MSQRIEVSEDTGLFEVEIVIRLEDDMNRMTTGQRRKYVRTVLDGLVTQALDAVGRDPEAEAHE